MTIITAAIMENLSVSTKNSNHDVITLMLIMMMITTRIVIMSKRGTFAEKS